MIDAVITYVNGSDPEWKKQYAAVAGKEPSRRYRDWGMLEWQVGNIRRFLPFIDKKDIPCRSPSFPGSRRT